MEVRRKVETIKVDYRCPKCNNGFLRPTKMVLILNPPIFPHKCNNNDCDYKESFKGVKYPYVDYESDDDVKTDDTAKIQNDVVHGKGDDEFCVEKRPFDNYSRKPSGK